jgi:hypothetical protein
MTVPEAPMNEHDRAILWKHDVRPSGDILHMQPESKTPRVKSPSESKLGLRILAANVAHHL